MFAFVDHLASVFGVAWPIVGGAFAALLALIVLLAVKRLFAAAAFLRFVLTFMLALIGTIHGVRAHDAEGGTLLLCDTAEQAERVAVLSDASGSFAAAAAAVSAEVNDPAACMVAAVVYIRADAAAMTVRRAAGSLDVVAVMVIGVITPDGVRPIRPVPQFSLLPTKGHDI